MKNILLLFIICCSSTLVAQKETEESALALEHFELQHLLDTLEGSGRPYLPFLNRNTLRCGIYTLKVGAIDGQKPHDLDEVYYVLEGKSKFTTEGKEVTIKPGDILFVKAKAVHQFHDITEDLKLLVFFSTAPVD